MTIVESYSVGTPVIGTNMGNVGSLVEDDKTGWKFSTDSKEDLINALKNARNARIEFTEDLTGKYSEEKNYEQLRKIYETCCNHH